MNNESNSQTAPVVLDQVTINFGEKAIHREISLTINPGEVVVLLGPSGTGKTVLLKLIMGLLFPSSGAVYLHGKDTKKLTERELRDERLKIGMLFQGAALFDSLSVFDNIAFPLRQRGERSTEIIAETVSEKLGIVGLSHTIDMFPPELSGGQKKRIGIARALATSPEVLLFDEPTTGLDPTSRKMIDTLIVQLRREFSISSIVVTHDMDSAKAIADRIVLINDGRVVVDGPAATLWKNDPLVKRFIAGEWNLTPQAQDELPQEIQVQ